MPNILEVVECTSCMGLLYLDVLLCRADVRSKVHEVLLDCEYGAIFGCGLGLIVDVECDYLSLPSIQL